MAAKVPDFYKTHEGFFLEYNAPTQQHMVCLHDCSTFGTVWQKSEPWPVQGFSVTEAFIHDHGE